MQRGSAMTRMSSRARSGAYFRVARRASASSVHTRNSWLAEWCGAGVWVSVRAGAARGRRVTLAEQGQSCCWSIDVHTRLCDRTCRLPLGSSPSVSSRAGPRQCR